MTDSPQLKPSRRFHLFSYALLLGGFLLSARAPAALRDLWLPEPPPPAPHLCGQQLNDCRWQSQGEVYADCPAPTGLGYGCLWRCKSFWCASTSILDRGTTHAATVAAKDICTVTAGSGEYAETCKDM